MGLTMGAYLSKPVTEKISNDEANDKLNCGTSSMQGWRVSQEDAHNCIINYDTNTSYFAVYDGHGGPEVALYCSQKLPEFLKELEHYKTGNLEKALEDAFLKFDSTIATDEVIAKLKLLKELAGDGEVGDSEEDEEEEENVTNLYEEATMPIEQVIEKYTSDPAFKTYLKARKLLSDSSCTSTVKSDKSVLNNSTIPSSEASGEAVSSSSCVKNEVISSSNNKLSDDSSISRELRPSETKNVTNEFKIEHKLDSPDSSVDAREECTPSNNITEKDVASQNGEVESTENGESFKTYVSSSSAVTPHENGEITRKGKGKALTKTKGVIPKTPTSQRPKRSARQYYNKILSCDEESEEESEDEKDETFQDPNEISSDDDNDDEEVADFENNSDESSIEEEEEKECDEEEEDNDDEEFDDIALNVSSMREIPGADSGSTAVVALIRENELYVANAGDSRCVVCRNGQAVEMSVDHKPEDKLERNRITKAGGYVNFEGRVDGGLNLSRAIGDHAYKQNKQLSDREQKITALPDIKTLTINPHEDEFMVLACDGIWNFMSSQEVVDFVRPRLQEGKVKLSQICEEMFDHCLAPNTLCDGTGCDNMTAIIVQFKSNLPKRSATTEPDQCKRMKTEETSQNLSA